MKEKNIQRHATSIFIRTIITLYSKMMKRGNCKLNTNHSLQIYSIIICRVRVLRFKFRHSAQSHQHTTHITVRYVRRVYSNIHTQLPSFTGIIFKCVDTIWTVSMRHWRTQCVCSNRCDCYSSAVRIYLACERMQCASRLQSSFNTATKFFIDLFSKYKSIELIMKVWSVRLNEKSWECI